MERERVALLDELGKCFDRDRSYLVNEAVEQYLARQQRQIAEVQRSLAEVKAGQFLTEEEFLADVAAWDQ
jgi:predicted transcriptional regulator